MNQVSTGPVQAGAAGSATEQAKEQVQEVASARRTSRAVRR